MSHRRRLPLLAFVLALGLTPAAADAKIATGPKGVAFYRPPAGKLKGPHGSVIWARTIKTSGLPLPQAGTTYLVLYRSTLPNGRPAAVSGTITIPAGRPPRGGFPTVAWAHGTTGIADVCAPTRMMYKRKLDTYGRDQRDAQTDWVKQGWAVTDSDYQGLGTAPMHPYLIGVSEGRSVIDSVLAARAISRQVGKSWAVVGHSQGGHATLWAASLAERWAPQLQLEGAAAIAPANHIGEQGELIDQIDGNPFGGLPALIVAAAARELRLVPADVFSATAMQSYPLIDRQCDLDETFGDLPLSEHFNPAFDTKIVTDYLHANDPEDLSISVPVLVTQGTDDGTVLPVLTDQLAADYEQRGIELTYTKLEGVGHGDAAAAARSANLAFLERVL